MRAQRILKIQTTSASRIAQKIGKLKAAQTNSHAIRAGSVCVCVCVSINRSNNNNDADRVATP